MRHRAIPIVIVAAFLGGCTAHHKPPAQGTLADLQKVAPDVKDAETQQSVEQAPLCPRLLDMTSCIPISQPPSTLRPATGIARARFG